MGEVGGGWEFDGMMPWPEHWWQRRFQRSVGTNKWKVGVRDSSVALVGLTKLKGPWRKKAGLERGIVLAQAMHLEALGWGWVGIPPFCGSLQCCLLHNDNARVSTSINGAWEVHNQQKGQQRSDNCSALLNVHQVLCGRG